MTPRVAYAFGLLLWALLCLTVLTHGDEMPNAISLSLQECISLALESNLNIQVERIQPQIQETLVTMAEARFDPTFTFGSSVSRSEEPSSTPFLAGADVRSNSVRRWTSGFSDPLSTGGSYDLAWNASRSRSNSALQVLNPAYNSSVILRITQPLLEGRGVAVNKAPSIIARNNQQIALLQLKSQLIRTLSDVQVTYWELVFALENLKVQQLSLKQAEDLLNVNQRLKEVGKASQSDVLQAKAAVASRQANVIAAQDAARDAEDELKRITNLIADASAWQNPVLPIDTPSTQTIDVNLEESLEIALQDRPEYAQSKLLLENSAVTIKVSDNGRLPTLDLEASLALNGLGDALDDPLSQIGKTDYRSWAVQFAFRLPLGRRVEKAEFARAQLENQQRLIALKDLEQQIITEVRGTTRQLGADAERIRATQAAEELARQVLSTEQKKYQLGLSTSYELLQFQADLATAMRNHLSAVIGYRESIVALYQALGTTLDELGIELAQ